MNRIAAAFERVRDARRAALIPFVTAGDPSPQSTVAVMHGLVAGGADVIELGVPFSDPMADGPVIQRSSERALKHGVTLKHVLEYVAEFRRKDNATPVVLMGYANPIERMGHAAFVSQAKAAGVDGVLIVDYPPEEAGEWLKAIEAAIRRIRKHTKVPVGVGFGIRDGATAKRVAAFADAVVIGSRVVQDLADAPGQAAERAKAVMTEFSQALHREGVRA